MALRSTCLVLTLMALASPVAGVVISADGTTFGTIVTSYLFAALFLIATLLSLLSLLKTPNCRFPYTLILLSSAFSFGAFVISAALSTSENSNQPYSKGFLIALNTVHALFSNWAIPCLFLAVVLIVKQRHTAIDLASHASGGYGAGSLHVLLVIANYVIFIFTFALCTTHGVLTLLSWKITLDDGVSADEKRRVAGVERKAHLILQVMFCLVAYDAVALAVALHVIMRRAELYDKICQLLALGVAPLAALAGVVGLVFEIVFYISKDNDSGDIEHLLEIILIQMLLLAIIVSLLIVGFRPQDWELEKGAHYEYRAPNNQKSRGPQPEARTSHYQLHRLQNQASRATQPSVHSPHSPIAQYWRESGGDQYGQGSNGQHQVPILRHQYALASTAYVPSVRDMYTQEIELLHRQYSRHN